MGWSLVFVTWTVTVSGAGMLSRAAVGDQAARDCICPMARFSSSDNAGGTRPW